MPCPDRHKPKPFERGPAARYHPPHAPTGRRPPPALLASAPPATGASARSPTSSRSPAGRRGRLLGRAGPAGERGLARADSPYARAVGLRDRSGLPRRSAGSRTSRRRAALDALSPRTSARGSPRLARRAGGRAGTSVRALKRARLRARFARFERDEWARRTARARALEAFAREEAAWLDDYALFVAIHDDDARRPRLDGVAARRCATASPAALADARARLSRDDPLPRLAPVAGSSEQWHAARRGRERARGRARGRPAVHGGDRLRRRVGAARRLPARRARRRPARRVQRDRAGLGPPGLPLGRDGAGGLPWLHERARRMADLYGLYRVDHVVGLYRTYFFPNDGGAGRVHPGGEPAQTRNGERVLGIFSRRARGSSRRTSGRCPTSCARRSTRSRSPGYRVLRWERHWKSRRQPSATRAAGRPSRSPHRHARHRRAGGLVGRDAGESAARSSRCPQLAAPARARAPDRFDDGVRDALLELDLRGRLGPPAPAVPGRVRPARARERAGHGDRRELDLPDADGPRARSPATSRARDGCAALAVAVGGRAARRSAREGDRAGAERVGSRTELVPALARRSSRAARASTRAARLHLPAAAPRRASASTPPPRWCRTSHALGVTDLYLSPILAGRARLDARLRRRGPRAGSTPSSAARRASRALRDGAAPRAAWGMLVDFVPNHMGIGPAEPLVDGRARERPVVGATRASSTSTGSPLKAELENKVLVPVLGDQYGVVLERGELQLAREGGALRGPLLGPRLPGRAALGTRSCCATGSTSCAPSSARATSHSRSSSRSAPSLEKLAPRTETVARRRSPSARARRRSRSGGSPRSARRARGARRSSTRTCASFNGAPGRSAQLRPARAAPRRAGLPARVLARRRRGDQLPPLLRHERARRDPHGGPARLRRRRTGSCSASSRDGQASPGCASTTPTASTRPTAYFRRLQAAYCVERGRAPRRRARGAPLDGGDRGARSSSGSSSALDGRAAPAAAALRGGGEDPRRAASGCPRAGTWTAPPATSSSPR